MSGWEGGPSRTARFVVAASIGSVLIGTEALPCAAQRWDVGARAGVTASTMAFEDETAHSLSLATPGLQLGLVGSIGLTRLFELRGEVVYTEKGFDSNVDEQLKLAYVEVPLLLAIRWPVTASPRFFAGPVVGLEVRCRSQRVLGLGRVGCDDALLALQRTKRDVGLAVGGGGGFAVGPGEMSLELWLNQGLRDISREARPDGYVHHRVLTVSGAYRVHFGGGP